MWRMSQLFLSIQWKSMGSKTLYRQTFEISCVSQKYKVLARNSRWCSSIDLTQYDIMTPSSRHSWFVLSCIGSQWARCSTFKYFTYVCGSSLQHTPETLHLPQLHLYRSATGCIHGGYSCYMCSSSISYMLTAACCGCIGSSKSRYLVCRSSVADLFCQDQIH